MFDIYMFCVTNGFWEPAVLVCMNDNQVQQQSNKKKSSVLGKASSSQIFKLKLSEMHFVFSARGGCSDAKLLNNINTFSVLQYASVTEDTDIICWASLGGQFKNMRWSKLII